MRERAQVPNLHVPPDRPAGDGHENIPLASLTQPAPVRGLTATLAVLDEIDALLRRSDSPGQHPDTLKALERLTASICSQAAIRPVCDGLLTLSRAFYADGTGRGRNLPDVDALHFRMLWTLQSIRGSLLKIAPPASRAPAVEWRAGGGPGGGG